MNDPMEKLIGMLVECLLLFTFIKVDFFQEVRVDARWNLTQNFCLGLWKKCNYFVPTIVCSHLSNFTALTKPKSLIHFSCAALHAVFYGHETFNNWRVCKVKIVFSHTPLPFSVTSGCLTLRHIESRTYRTSQHPQQWFSIYYMSCCISKIILGCHHICQHTSAFKL